MHEQICQILGLSAETWPPDHYTLLALSPGENDHTRIEHQVHERMERVRRYQLTHPEATTEAMNRLAQALVCLSLPAIGFAQSASTLRGVTAEDYFSFEFISDPNISPDGKLIAYVLTKIDRAQNRRNSAIWMVAADGSSPPWQFTTAPQNSNSPRWSPDGKTLAFLSSRPGGDSSAPAPVRTTFCPFGSPCRSISCLLCSVKHDSPAADEATMLSPGMNVPMR